MEITLFLKNHNLLWKIVTLKREGSWEVEMTWELKQTAPAILAPRTTRKVLRGRLCSHDPVFSMPNRRQSSARIICTKEPGAVAASTRPVAQDPAGVRHRLAPRTPLPAVLCEKDSINGERTNSILVSSSIDGGASVLSELRDTSPGSGSSGSSGGGITFCTGGAGSGY